MRGRGDMGLYIFNPFRSIMTGIPGEARTVARVQITEKPTFLKTFSDEKEKIWKDRRGSRLVPHAGYGPVYPSSICATIIAGAFNTHSNSYPRNKYSRRRHNSDNIIFTNITFRIVSYSGFKDAQ